METIVFAQNPFLQNIPLTWQHFVDNFTSLHWRSLCIYIEGLWDFSLFLLGKQSIPNCFHSLLPFSPGDDINYFLEGFIHRRMLKGWCFFFFFSLTFSPMLGFICWGLLLYIHQPLAHLYQLPEYLDPLYCPSAMSEVILLPDYPTYKVCSNSQAALSCLS